MYRIFCESYKNFLNSIDNDSYRIKNSEPLSLILDIKKYEEEEKKQSEIYKKLCDLLSYMKENLKRYPKLKAFLWTLDARNIKEKKYNIAKKEDLEEQTKLVNSILKLAYWY